MKWPAGRVWPITWLLKAQLPDPKLAFMKNQTEVFFIVSIGVLIGCAALLPAISQDQSYHAFADRRSWGFMPNAADTLSNLAFVIAGAWGNWRLLSGRIALSGPSTRLPLAVFFTGVLMTGLTSGFYHLAPSDSRLVVDRLAMSVSFAAVLALLAADRVSWRMGLWSLWGLIFLAPLTVLIWAFSGNLTPYAVLQFGGIILIASLCWRPPLQARGFNFIGLLIFYGLAKIAEGLDHEFFEFTFGLISGHSAKHILAALGVFVLIRRRGGLRTDSLAPTADKPPSSYRRF